MLHSNGHWSAVHSNDHWSDARDRGQGIARSNDPIVASRSVAGRSVYTIRVIGCAAPTVDVYPFASRAARAARAGMWCEHDDRQALRERIAPIAVRGIS